MKTQFESLNLDHVMRHNLIIPIKRWWLSVLLLLTFLSGFSTLMFAGQEQFVAEAQRLNSIVTTTGLFNDECLGPLQEYKSYADAHELIDHQFQANYMLGKYHLLRLNSSEAQIHFKAAVKQAEKNKDYELQGFALDRLGITYTNENMPDSALFCFQNSLNIYYANGLDHRVWSPLMLIAQLYQANAEYEKAKEYGEKALSSLNGREEHIAKTVLLNYLIALASEFEQAEDYARYLDLYLLEVNPENIDDDNNHLAIFFHSDDGPLDRIESIKRAIALLTDQHPTIALVNAHYSLGKEYFSIKDYTSAIHEWESGKNINQSIQGVGYSLAFHKSLSEAYALVGNNELAMSSLRSFYTVRDSINRTKNTQLLDELQLKYETAQKEETIAQQSFAIQQKTRERNILAIGGGMLIVAIFFIINALSGRLKAQKIIARKEMETLQQKHNLDALKAMVKGQEEERKRIAFDLHDGLGGLLSTAKHQIEKLLDKVDTRTLNGEAKRTSELIDMACEDVRRIAHNMMPHALMKMGLAAAIGDLINLLQSNTSVDISFQCITEIDRINEEREIMLYRIVQELVQNAIKHAEASSVIVQLSQHQNVLSLVVEDDGKGFDISKAEGEGLGLKSIDSRIKFLDGQVDFYSSTKSGTTVSVDIPMMDKYLAKQSGHSKS